MIADGPLDFRLMRSLCEGESVLPDDVESLRGYLGMIEALLAEKASTFEQSWDEACGAAAEIETLHRLETTVAERAISVRAPTLSAVRGKLAIWRTLVKNADEPDCTSPADRLILSIEADLERLSDSRTR